MRLLTLAALAASLLTACIQEADPDYPNSDDDRSGEYDDGDDGSDHQDYNDGNDHDSFGCASAPSGAGAWEDEGDDGLHGNDLWDGTDDWAYTLNSSETACQEMSWAPYQDDGGYIKMWSWDGNKGCDWVIPW